MKYNQVDIEEDFERQHVGCRQRHCAGFRPWWLILVIVFIVVAAVITGVVVNKNASTSPTPVAPDSLDTCLAKRVVTPNWKTTQPVTDDVILIFNTTIWTGDGVTVIPNADILLQNGKIAQVSASGERITPPQGSFIYDAAGRISTPGIVDIHSHIGVYPFPEVDSVSDGNEATNPTFPQLRAIDAIHPWDWAIPQMLAEGVTTAQILPGSSNLMGGEGTVVKLKIFPNRFPRVQDLLIPNAPRTLKMACGENPKKGPANPIYPATRMGEAWMMRERWQAASDLVRAQNQWCSANPVPASDFPAELEVQGLAALLRGEALAHIHCYLVEDIEMILRLSQEFGFKIAAFHHALEAWKIPELFLAQNITAAIFVDHWGFKVEGYEGSVHAPTILKQNGVKLAIKSDHPVLHARDLLYQAARGHHYGLDAQSTIAAITSGPAAALGLGDRVGTIRAGMEADVVIWDRDPLVLGAAPHILFIDGELMTLDQAPRRTETIPPNSDVITTRVSSVIDTSICATSLNRSVALPTCYAVTGAAVFTGEPNEVINDGTVIVEGGIVTCLGPALNCTVPASCERFTIAAGGGVVIPGLIETLAHLGQIEVDQEATANDGALASSVSTASALTVDLLDGVRVGSRHVRAAWAGGVTTAVATPIANTLIAGTGSSFSTCCGTVVNDLIVASQHAVYFTVGSSARSTGLSASISGQIAQLRQALTLANSSSPTALPALVQVVNGELPLIVRVHQADIIGAVLKLQKKFPSIKLTLQGASEAHFLAPRLAAQGVSVILAARQARHDFESQRYVENAIGILSAAGVRVALGTEAADMARNLRWEAGLATRYVSYDVALRAVTSTAADLVGLAPTTTSAPGRIKEGTKASFTLYNGDPLSLASTVQLVASSSSVECLPLQF